MNRLLSHLLFDSAANHPARPAIVFGDRSITYAELEDLTGRLAALLGAHGVRRGDRVGIYMSKSMESVIGLLGILKAGAAYVPLDPNAPPARIAYIIDNCGIRVLLTSAAKLAKLVGADPAKPGGLPLSCAVIMDGGSPAVEIRGLSVLTSKQVLEADPSHAPADRLRDTDLAYVLYTSGSTGTPKGVMISHLNSLTFVNWAAKVTGVSEADRISNHAPLHFDLSIYDIFVSLKCGATLLPVPDGLSSFPYRLAEWVEERGITVWYSVPSVLTSLYLHGGLTRFDYPSLRTIIFAGEVFPIKYLRGVMGLLPRAEYFNFYGPTETNVITYYRVPSMPDLDSGSIPIGVAAAGADVFAASESGALVGRPGEVGELYARGSCVAQGYWADAEKTRTVFVPDPRDPHDGAIVYRTGDLVTLDESGNYLFLGRRDHMIKRLGYRIELGEIENALHNYPDVEDAAVVAIPDELAGNRIQAFVTLHKTGSAGAAALMDYCAGKLPRYMVPEKIHIRTRMPRTSTGKIDKTSLARDAAREGGSA